MFISNQLFSVQAISNFNSINEGMEIKLKESDKFEKVKRNEEDNEYHYNNAIKTNQQTNKPIQATLQTQQHQQQQHRQQHRHQLSLYASAIFKTVLLVFISIHNSLAQAPSDASLAASLTEIPSCGVNRFNNESPLTERIVGGNNSLHGEWPWQISVRLNHPQVGKLGHWCGGTLIDKQWIITAAHCVSNPLFTLPQPMYWEIKLGEFNQKTVDEQEKIIGVSFVSYWPLYKGYDNDIALMKLSEPITPSEYVRPVCIPDDKTSFMGRECVATGWGKVDNNKKSSNILQKVGVNVYETSECQSSYYTKFKISIDKWHLCAGARDGGKGTCHGDSGGPLQCRVNGKWMIAGITSFGSGCAKPGFPDVYTNVPYFSTWIRDTIKSS